MAWRRWGEAVARLREPVRRAECAVLFFPVAVTVLAAVALLCGGRVAAWQWWAAAAAAFVWLAFWRGAGMHARLAACGAFAVVLAGIWVAAGCVVSEGGGVDNVVYHFPAIRLLIEGWNPVYAPTPETLAASMGVEPWEMRLWHALALPKGVWIFNAAAYRFTGTPFALTFPLWPFLFLAAAGQVVRLLRTMGWGMRLVAVVLLWAWAPAHVGITDAAVCLGGVGLLAAMARALAGERGVALPLVCLSFWMMVSKQVGLLTCFVFWACFSVVLLWRIRWAAVPRLAALGGGLAVLFLVVCANPYLTSWRHYGHPLYPVYSVDEARFPSHDLTEDFTFCNADAQAMGHVGRLVNAYLSPWLAACYYEWKLGRGEFRPQCYVWRQTNPKGREASPLTASARWGLLAAFMAVALFGGRRLRFVWVAAAVGIVAFPTSYLGFSRYVPWLALVKALGVVVTAEWAVRRLPKAGRTAVWGVLALAVAAIGGGAALYASIQIAQTETMRKVLRAAPPKVLCNYGGAIPRDLSVRLGYPPINPETFGDPFRIVLLNLRLLSRQEPALKGAEVRRIRPEEVETLPVGPNGEFRMGPDYVPAEWSGWTRNAANPSRLARYLNYPALVLRSYFVSLPRNVLARLGELLPGR